MPTNETATRISEQIFSELIGLRSETGFCTVGLDFKTEHVKCYTSKEMEMTIGNIVMIFLILVFLACSRK
jgi:uncharacterized membrane protein affecting hemolysin expression